MKSGPDDMMGGVPGDAAPGAAEASLTLARREVPEKEHFSLTFTLLRLFLDGQTPFYVRNESVC